MEVMFDSRYHIIGQEVPIKLRFKDVIFVMEDVDALSKIVHRRDGKAEAGASSSSAKPALSSVQENDSVPVVVETKEAVAGAVGVAEDKDAAALLSGGLLAGSS
eukprot:CAMPEP_0170637040 /NCGR_PEP_ID=MMETSP0224-20130122/38176_1 /TAXON_ID=285029 /ORGANISM="Togula jolla, Strain CCCM 725" /LENGTH=103 /DNA_ID=CAMNT_0010966847 /DNA_START=1 /DNA_END=309 /DNA_ORIENTATION=-